MAHTGDEQNLKAAEKQRDQILKQKKLTFDEVTNLEVTAVNWKPKLAASKNPAIIQ